jgi:hypothetical protein
MLTRQCVAVFFLALAMDIIGAVHIRALIDNRMSLAVITVIVLHVIGFWEHNWFIKHEEMARWAITWAAALGAGLGTVVVIMWF